MHTSKGAKSIERILSTKCIQNVKSKIKKSQHSHCRHLELKKKSNRENGHVYIKNCVLRTIIFRDLLALSIIVNSISTNKLHDDLPQYAKKQQI